MTSRARSMRAAAIGGRSSKQRIKDMDIEEEGEAAAVGPHSLYTDINNALDKDPDLASRLLHDEGFVERLCDSLVSMSEEDVVAPLTTAHVLLYEAKERGDVPGETQLFTAVIQLLGRTDTPNVCALAFKCIEEARVSLVQHAPSKLLHCLNAFEHTDEHLTKKVLSTCLRVLEQCHDEPPRDIDHDSWVLTAARALFVFGSDTHHKNQDMALKILSCWTWVTSDDLTPAAVDDLSDIVNSHKHLFALSWRRKAGIRDLIHVGSAIAPLARLLGKRLSQFAPNFTKYLFFLAEKGKDEPGVPRAVARGWANLICAFPRDPQLGEAKLHTNIGRSLQRFLEPLKLGNSMMALETRAAWEFIVFNFRTRAKSAETRRLIFHDVVHGMLGEWGSDNVSIVQSVISRIFAPQSSIAPQLPRGRPTLDINAETLLCEDGDLLFDALQVAAALIQGVSGSPLPPKYESMWRSSLLPHLFGTIAGLVENDDDTVTAALRGAVRLGRSLRPGRLLDVLIAHMGDYYEFMEEHAYEDLWLESASRLQGELAFHAAVERLVDAVSGKRSAQHKRALRLLGLHDSLRYVTERSAGNGAGSDNIHNYLKNHAPSVLVDALLAAAGEDSATNGSQDWRTASTGALRHVVVETTTYPSEKQVKAWAALLVKRSESQLEMDAMEEEEEEEEEGDERKRRWLAGDELAATIAEFGGDASLDDDVWIAKSAYAFCWCCDRLVRAPSLDTVDMATRQLLKGLLVRLHVLSRDTHDSSHVLNVERVLEWLTSHSNVSRLSLGSVFEFFFAKERMPAPRDNALADAVMGLWDALLSSFKPGASLPSSMASAIRLSMTTKPEGYFERTKAFCQSRLPSLVNVPTELSPFYSVLSTPVKNNKMAFGGGSSSSGGSASSSAQKKKRKKEVTFSLEKSPPATPSKSPVLSSPPSQQKPQSILIKRPKRKGMGDSSLLFEELAESEAPISVILSALGSSRRAMQQYFNSKDITTVGDLARVPVTAQFPCRKQARKALEEYFRKTCPQKSAKRKLDEQLNDVYFQLRSKAEDVLSQPEVVEEWTPDERKALGLCLSRILVLLHHDYDDDGGDDGEVGGTGGASSAGGGGGGSLSPFR